MQNLEISVHITVRLDDYGQWEAESVVTGDENDRIKDGDILDVAEAFREVVERRIPKTNQS